ncbi:hypothetical protein AYI83_21545 [Shewanella algae]|uniref:RHS repeat-associated core domain-containing protein n=1 Tax=Shewanella algae TaxID=38313 RepID=UPI0021B39898|nr:RHS repeat-associated core domain-containing protein [Shewanella algae]TVK90666.1 hypothetical protein AYI83_21545 [Shewanella algae]
MNLTYMQARYYDPLIGRFYANDPVGFRDVHSFNRYAYGNNNPYKYVDPDGAASQAVVLPRERGKTFVYPKSSHAHAAKRHASGFKGSNTGTSSNQFKSALGMSSYEVSAAVVTAVVEAGAEYYQPSRGSSVYTAETGVSVGENGETKVSVATKEFRLLSDNALKSEVVSMLSEAGIEAGPNNVNIQNVEVVTTIAPDDGSFKSNDAVKMREQVEASK